MAGYGFRWTLAVSTLCFTLLSLDGVLTSSAFYDDIPHLCRDKPSGITRLASRRCDAYIECFAGMAFMRLCAPGTSYNSKTSACDLPRDQSCRHQGHVHQVHGSEAHQDRHIYNKYVAPKSSHQQTQLKKQPAPVVDGKTNEAPPKRKSNYHMHLKNYPKRTLQKRYGRYQPTFIITSPIRFYPLGLRISRRIRRSLHDSSNVDSKDMQVAQLNEALEVSIDNARTDRLLNPKNLGFNNLDGNGKNSQGSQPHPNDAQISVLQNQLAELQTLKKQQQKLQEILRNNPTGPLAQALKPYIKPKSNPKPTTIQGKSSTLGKASYGQQSQQRQQRQQSQTEHSSLPRRQTSNPRRKFRRMFGSPKSMLPFRTRSTMPAFDAPKRKWRFRTRRPTKRQNSLRSRSSSNQNSGNGYNGDTSSRGSNDEKMMMDMFDKLKTETQGESMKIARKYNTGISSIPKTYQYSYPSNSQYTTQKHRYPAYKNEYYSPQQGAKSFDTKSNYDDNYNRYGKQNQMYGPDAYTNNFANGGDGSAHNEEQTDAVTKSPIWIHPFANGGSFMPDDNKNQNKKYGEYENKYPSDSHSEYNSRSNNRANKQSYDEEHKAYIPRRHSHQDHQDNTYRPRNAISEQRRYSEQYGYPTTRDSHDYQDVARNPQQEYNDDSAPNRYNTNHYHNDERHERNYNKYSPEVENYKRHDEDRSYNYPQEQQVERRHYTSNKEQYEMRPRKGNDYSAYDRDSSQEYAQDSQRQHEDDRYRYDDRDNNNNEAHRYRREDTKEEDKDHYKDPEKREKSDHITDPDSYYNSDNLGPWQTDDYSLPPEATYNGNGRGGGGSKGNNQGGEGGPEGGGTHTQYGRKPPKFDTFPFNFMPKHLTGPMFTDTGSLDFKKDAGYGHVGNVELDGNGDVPY